MIKDEQLRKKLLRSFPKIPEKELISISKKHMPQYVIYKQTVRGKYECYCTCCEKWYINDTISGRDFVPIVGHKQKGVCLKCGKDVTFLARGNSRKSIFDKENFAIFKLKDGFIYLQTYQICGFFTDVGKKDFDYKIKDKIYNRNTYMYHRYVFTPSGAQKWEHWWQFNHRTNKYDGAWEALKSEGGPTFFLSLYVNDSSHICIGQECIADSFLNYAVDAAFRSRHRYIIDQHIIKYLCEVCKHPNIEYLFKTGFGFIIEDKIAYRHMSGLRLNWKQNDVKKMLKLNKVEMDELADTDSQTLSNYYRMRKLDPVMDPAERAVYARKVEDIDVLEYILSKTDLSLRKALYYKEKHKMPLRDWKDYIDQCETLQYDLKDESISRPRDFYEAHERLSRVIETMANEKKQRLFDLTNQKRVDMQYTDEELGLMIVLPTSINDIVREGKLQNHCVGGYADRHAEGKLHILFLRKIDEPHTPYYTMEVNTKGNIVQCRGYANNWASRGGKPKTDDVVEFEKRYQEYLRKLFKKKAKIKVA